MFMQCQILNITNYTVKMNKSDRILIRRVVTVPSPFYSKGDKTLTFLLREVNFWEYHWSPNVPSSTVTDRSGVGRTLPGRLLGTSGSPDEEIVY